MPDHTMMIHIDALRHDYVTPEDMPFLYELMSNGLTARLVPPFGFEPDGAYLTGTDPETYLGGAHFIRANGDSLLKFMRFAPAFLDRVPQLPQLLLRKLLQWHVGFHGKTERLRKSGYYFQIPFTLMPFFKPCEDKFVDEPGFGEPATTIFDELRTAESAFFCHGALKHNSRSDAVWQRVSAELAEHHRFSFIFISDLDSVGHRFGPESEQRRRTGRNVDFCIKEIYGKAEQIFEDIEVVVFGDHGMVSVVENIDVTGHLAEIELQQPGDYLCFLDSTFVRFWYHNSQAQEQVRSRLDSVRGLFRITDQQREDYAIRYPDNRFGDDIYWVNDGFQVYPNYWARGAAPLGMHGYPRSVEDNHSRVILYPVKKTKSLPESVEMVDVYQTVMSSLDLSPGDLSRGKALQDF